MRIARPLLWLSAGLDLLGLWVGALLAAKLRGHPLALALHLDGVLFTAGFFFLAWFLGGYSFLRWPWMPYRQVSQRFLLLVVSALAMAVAVEWLLNAPITAIWFHRSTLVILGLVLTSWGLIHRRCLQPIAQRQEVQRQAILPVASHRPQIQNRITTTATDKEHQLMLLFVAYHPSQPEVEQLKACLEALAPSIRYAVVVNDHQPGEVVEQLAKEAVCFLANRDNPGYGRAINRLVVRLGSLPPYIGVLNTDLMWEPDTFEQLLQWLVQNPDVMLAVPQIRDEAGAVSLLCKRNPTLLGLMSRRFVPNWLKPSWLRRYDRWYVMADCDYNKVIDATYLSGCCMLVRSDAFRLAGGFDERYFLYLEDADLTRTLSLSGRCVHLPVAHVVHGWGRGSYRNLDLMGVNIASAWHYFRKWGWSLW